MGATTAGATASAKRLRVIIPHKAGSQWWEKPGFIWQGVGATKERRLERVIATRLLPLVQHLESTYLAKKGVKPLLYGKSLMEIEKSPASLSRAIALFDKAYAKGLVAFQGKGKKLKRPNPDMKVGSCGLSVNEARNFYIRKSAKKMIGKSSDLGEYLSGCLGDIDFNNAAILKRLLTLSKFDLPSLDLLNEGLDGRFDRLLQKDDRFLSILEKAGYKFGIQPLFQALDDNFVEILKWDADMLEAIFEHLDHPAKIEAMGTTLLMIEDVRVLKAIGSWPIKEFGDGKPTKTHIAVVRKRLGGDFLKLLTGPAAGIEEAGRCSVDQLDELKHYLDYIDDKVMYILGRLPFDQQMGILGGLLAKLGTGFMESYLTNKKGHGVLVAMIKSIQSMEERGSAPKDIKSLIQGDFFDDILKPYLPR